MCAALAARGHQVDLVTTNADGNSGRLNVLTGKRVDQSSGHGIWYERAGSWSGVWQAAPDLGKRLEKLIPAADIVEIHSLYLYHTWRASRLALQHGVPYIIRPHGSLNVRDRRHHLVRKKIYELLIENRTLQFAAGLHCTSVSESMQLPAKIRDRAFTIPHGVDEEILSLPRFDERPISGAILFLGRITPKKGLDVLLVALSELVHRGVSARLTVAGAGEESYEREMTGLASQLGLSENVDFIGHVDPGARSTLLVNHDVFVLPSRDENFGIAVAEALGAGLPVIVTPEVAIAEYIDGTPAGLVVDRDPQSIAKGVEILLSDHSARVERRRSAAEVARRHFSWETAGQLIEDMYNKCLSPSQSFNGSL
jgi:glycosyltransferase involved in cell wall biosynthesis